MRPLDYRDLKRALGEVSKRVDKEGVYKGNVELQRANKKALKVFNTVGPVYANDKNGRPRNITLLSLIRADRMIRRHGIQWPLFDWEDLLEWLYENWDKVLRVLLRLLVLVVI